MEQFDFSSDYVKQLEKRVDETQESLSSVISLVNQYMCIFSSISNEKVEVTLKFFPPKSPNNIATTLSTDKNCDYSLGKAIKTKVDDILCWYIDFRNGDVGKASIEETPEMIVNIFIKKYGLEFVKLVNLHIEKINETIF